ncbi:MAG: FhaA domain-containing protein [Chloroflexota bacterium]
MAAKPFHPLTRFEALAERLLEGGFTRLFGSRIHRAELTEQLSRALEDHKIAGPDGVWLAPDDYQIQLHPTDLARLGERPAHAELEKELSGQLIALAQQSGMTLMRRPRVSLTASADVAPHQVRVLAHLVASPKADVASPTREINTGEAQSLSPTPAAAACYLHLDQRRFPLASRAVTLGRNLDNDVVIEHPRVSRHHAQLRQRQGQWWIIDLDSANGTTVNGQSVSQAILHPGDVISIAGVEIHFQAQ